MFGVADSNPKLFGIIIGAMKAGTTSLFKTLADIPEVASCREKEPRYFDDLESFNKGPGYYLSLFQYKPTLHKIALEASTEHTKAPYVSGSALRMAMTGWKFRFVYLVRNPIERIRSHYIMAYAEGYPIRPVREGIDSYALDICRYHYQLGQFLNYFPREQFLVVNYEDLIGFPNSTVERVMKHFSLNTAGKIPQLRRENYTNNTYMRKAIQNIAHQKKISLETAQYMFEGLVQPSRIQQIEIVQTLKEDYDNLYRDFGVKITMK